LKYIELIGYFVFGNFLLFTILEKLLDFEVKRKKLNSKVSIAILAIFVGLLGFTRPSWFSQSVTDFANVFLAIFSVCVLGILFVSGRRLFLDFKDVQANLKESLKMLSKAQATLVSTEKFRVVGVMSTGIVLQINKPLKVILDRSEWLRNEALCNRLQVKNGFEEVERIQSEIMKISKVVSGLKSISRRSETDSLVPISLQRLLEDQVSLCKEFLSSRNIQFIFPKGKTEGYLLCRPSEIELILANLVHNSADAISTQKEPWIEIGTSVSEGSFSIWVIDSGNGIDSEVIERIMDPFFSTKPTGQGTGLGLSIGASLMENHGGSLTYDASSKKTKFVLKFPRHMYSLI
jgi:two-component system, NtrC family, sensor kinase